MNRYNNLLQSIADDLRIKRGKTETEIEYKCRILYSVMGRMATASLWDALELGEPVSVVHFKRRIDRIAFGYLKLYPELKTQYLELYSDEIKEEIYDVCLKSGWVYHTPYRIAPSRPCAAQTGGLYLTRSIPLGHQQCMSGLGTYSIEPPGIDCCVSPEEMFQLNESDLKEPWRELTKDVSWRPFQPYSQVEYLNLRPPFSGYWVKKPDTEIVSLCRIQTDGRPVYYLYRVIGKRYDYSPIPEWMLLDPVDTGTQHYTNYRQLSNSLLANLGVLPPAKFREDGEIVRVSLGYRMPPREMNLVKLYSWPISYFTPASPFQRIMDRTVFYAVKETLERTGYLFLKE